MKPSHGRTKAEQPREVLARLYESHARTVLGYLLRRTDPETAQDLVTETFLVAWLKIDKAPKHEAGWLCAIARNLLANHNRALQRRIKHEHQHASETTMFSPSAEEQVIKSRPAIVAALRQLSPVDQEVLMLVAWDGLSGADAATVLGCTRATFNVRLYRARKRLARLLESDRRPRKLITRPEEVSN